MVKPGRANIGARDIAMEAAAFYSGQGPAEVQTPLCKERRCVMPPRLMMAKHPGTRRGKLLSRRKVQPSLQPLPEEPDLGQDGKSRAGAVEDASLAVQFGLMSLQQAGKEKGEGGRSCKLPPRPRPCKIKQSLTRRLCGPLRKLRDKYVSCVWEIEGMGNWTIAVSGPHEINYADVPTPVFRD